MAKFWMIPAAALFFFACGDEVLRDDASNLSPSVHVSALGTIAGEPVASARVRGDASGALTVAFSNQALPCRWGAEAPELLVLGLLLPEQAGSVAPLEGFAGGADLRSAMLLNPIPEVQNRFFVRRADGAGASTFVRSIDLAAYEVTLTETPDYVRGRAVGRLTGPDVDVRFDAEFCNADADPSYAVAAAALAEHCNTTALKVITPNSLEETHAELAIRSMHATTVPPSAIACLSDTAIPYCESPTPSLDAGDEVLRDRCAFQLVEHCMRKDHTHNADRWAAEICGEFPFAEPTGT